jgi:alkylation response protein AidB-like acyl-CoA dehydrogenase
MADRDALTPESLRAEVSGWLAENWDAELPLMHWRRRLLDAGWAAPSWPKQWHGRGLAPWTDAVVTDALIDGGAVGTPVGGAMSLAGPTILELGPDPVRERFLEPILTGEETWCQLFSEPGAGSDLAGLQTTAVRDGDDWVVNGQKVWTTSAHHAELGMLLARTDPTAPKHSGITYFALPMKQDGVVVRPLRQMNWHQSFNEVFLTDARVPHANVIGEVGGGWNAARATLAHERRLGRQRPPNYSDAPGRALDEARHEADEYFAVYGWYPQRAGRPDLVLPHARARGLTDDPLIRQDIARLITLQRVSGWTSDRARSKRASGQPPGAEGSIGKLAASRIARESARVHSRIAGSSGMVRGDDAPFDGLIAEVLLSVPAVSIAGGTDEIQKNILGERILGLPREAAPDRNLPFNETRRNA